MLTLTKVFEKNLNGCCENIKNQLPLFHRIGFNGGMAKVRVDLFTADICPCSKSTVDTFLCKLLTVGGASI